MQQRWERATVVEIRPLASLNHAELWIRSHGHSVGAATAGATSGRMFRRPMVSYDHAMLRQRCTTVLNAFGLRRHVTVRCSGYPSDRRPRCQPEAVQALSCLYPTGIETGNKALIFTKYILLFNKSDK